MRTRIGGALVVFTLLLGPAPALRARQAQGTFAVFVASRVEGGEYQVEPVAFIDGRGAFVEPGADGEFSATSLSERYYKPGAKYRLLYGGAEAGSVTIREASKGECAPSAARVAVSTSARLGRDSTALATDATLKLRARGSRRAPTAAERAGALRLAKSILKQNRVSAAALVRTAALDLVATDLDGDGREELVGTYLVKSGPKVRDELFLVAAPKGNGYDAAFQKYDRINAREMMDASAIGEVGKGGFLAETFIDQLDADGDGVAEFFTAAGSFEGTTYKAYRREGGKWRAVYEHYSYRCAY
ncbi:MAG: hypothetical protein JOZ96_27750 [Acidobacteria bacterium]|nr:hypothetical protein [Acidobacteriota bacterium]